MPTDERVRLDVHQGVTPREQAAENYHNQPSGIIGTVWFHLPLLEQNELFAQEKILGSQCAARSGNEHEETEEIAGDDGQRVESAMKERQKFGRKGDNEPQEPEPEPEREEPGSPPAGPGHCFCRCK